MFNGYTQNTMIFSSNTTIVSFGDFLDVYHKLRQRGLPYLLQNLQFSSRNRVASKWDFYKQSSDFWLVPEIQQEWNYKISGDRNVYYEDYVSKKYFTGKKNIKILSVGCGEGAHERAFAVYGFASEIL